MRESLIARHLCNLQPYPIRMRILHDKVLGDKYGLTPQTIMSVGNFESIDQRDFIISVRKAFEEGKAQKFKCMDGSKMIIAPHQDGVLLKNHPGGKASREILLSEPLILSPDPDIRNRELNKLLNSLGPTAPDFSILQTASMERELSDTEIIEILTESATGLTAFKESLSRALKIEGVTLDHIIPDSFDYYERFCGPNPNDVDSEEYLSTILPAYRNELLRRDLAKGLDICLQGALRDDISPGQWIEHVPSDDLWNSMVACDPMSDPISLLGALDIALYRQNDERFRCFADVTV